VATRGPLRLKAEHTYNFPKLDLVLDPRVGGCGRTTVAKVPVIEHIEEQSEANIVSVNAHTSRVDKGGITYNAIKLKASTVCNSALSEWVKSDAVKATATSQRYEKIRLKSKT